MARRVRRGYTWFHPKSSVYIKIEGSGLLTERGNFILKEDGNYLIQG
jgi:hypothetical protein